MRSPRSLPLLASAAALAVACADRARAQPDELGAAARLLRGAAESRSPTLAFLEGLRSLGDVDLDRGEIRALLRRADVPAGSQLAAVLGPTRRLRRVGDRVQVLRDEGTVVRVGDRGVLVLQRRVAFDLGYDGGDVRLDEPRGIRVGKTRSMTYDLNHVVFDLEGETAAVNAGPWPFARTVRVDLSAPARSSAQAPESSGLTSAIEGVGTREAGHGRTAGAERVPLPRRRPDGPGRSRRAASDGRLPRGEHGQPRVDRPLGRR